MTLDLKMYEFYIEKNPYLSRRTRAFYSLDYVGYQQPGNPDYINTLKNTFGNTPYADIRTAAQELAQVVTPALQQIFDMSNATQLLCVVPRAKAERNYTANQMMFRKTMQIVARRLGYIDGTMCIVRHTDTNTTHLAKTKIVNEGSMPYPGITEETCHLSSSIRNRNILLIDDIYTRSVNIDEDAIQALYNNGAQSVVFYAVARTAYHG
jgi:predicted amidophosphoribosyltransferase